MHHVRFWDWAHGSPVKLTLAPEEEIFHTEGGSTEEGYSRTEISWDYDGRTIRSIIHSDSRDCDGRFQTFTKHMTFAGQLACVYSDSEVERCYHEGKLIKFPKWEEVTRNQRDHSAEAMGY